MDIVIIGHGRMGKEIESLALDKGHRIILTIDKDETHKFNTDSFRNADVAIEFSLPESAVENFKQCFKAGLPVVSGTTGWLNNMDEVVDLCNSTKGSFFYASNFSLGVNIFFEINRKLANLMDNYPNYKISLEEIHHTKKLDSPSGTAITLANDIVHEVKRKDSWVSEKTPSENEILISAKRIGKVNGEHTIIYDSSVDSIEIRHSAKNRKGFALGALLAAEFLVGKTGMYNMKDLLKI